MADATGEEHVRNLTHLAQTIDKLEKGIAASPEVSGSVALTNLIRATHECHAAMIVEIRRAYQEAASLKAKLAEKPAEAPPAETKEAVEEQKKLDWHNWLYGSSGGESEDRGTNSQLLDSSFLESRIAPPAAAPPPAAEKPANVEPQPAAKPSESDFSWSRFMEQ